MKFNSTLKLLSSAATMAFFALFTQNVTAQSTCENESVIWLETFGQGTAITSHPDVINISYRPGGYDFRSEGIYRIASNVKQLDEWHDSGDHTGDADGRMLVVNGEVGPFFQKIVTSPNPTGYADGVYSVSLYLINANEMGVCAPNPLLPEIELTVEYKDGSGNWIELANSPFTAAPVPQSSTPTWVNISGYFVLPVLDGSNIQDIRVTISDATSGGCGNDFAIDDIKLAFCPEGGVAPVTFTGITAQQKGNGVTVSWGTSQEINNDHFSVERSADGNTGWASIATVKGSGNSQGAHSYNAFDANPYSGNNYYRIRQVDLDGKSSFSKTASVRVDNAGMRVSVAGNPFINNFVVKFNGASQEVNARILDISGKVLAKETWHIANGESSKQFSNVSSLKSGVYILSVQSKSGAILYNGKILKR